MSKESAAINASPLIYLAKAEELGTLGEIFEKVYVPFPVYEETQRKGGSLDAWKIRSADFLQITDLDSSEEKLMNDIAYHYNLGEGESAVISICKSRGIDYALLADIDAIRRAKSLGVSVLEPVDIGKIAYANSAGKYYNYLIKLSTSAGYHPEKIEKELK